MAHRSVGCGVLLAAAGLWCGFALAAEPPRIIPQQPWTNFFGGQEVKLSFVIQFAAPFQGRLGWSYAADRRTIARGETPLAGDAATSATAEITLALPEVREEVVYDTELSLRVISASEEVLCQSRRAIRLFPRDPFAQRSRWLDELQITLFDPDDATRKTLDRHNIPYRLAQNLSALEGKRSGVVIVGEGTSLRVHGGLPGVLTQLAASGVGVLWLAPSEGSLPFPGSEPDQPHLCKVTLGRSGIVQQLDRRLDADAWPPEGRAVRSALVLTSRRERVLLEPVAPQDNAADSAWPWLEAEYPSGGRLVVCGFGMIQAWESGPAPRYLLLAIFERLSPTARSTNPSTQKE